MENRRPAFLDGTNSGLLAAIVAVPLLALIVWAGPLRGFVRRAADEQERQRVEIERFIERTATDIASTRDWRSRPLQYSRGSSSMFAVTPCKFTSEGEVLQPF